MVEALVQPLNIFLFGLGGSFLIPLLYRIASPLPSLAFVLALGGIALVSGACLWTVFHGQPMLESFTAGSTPPYSINLRVGPWEGVCAFSVNIVALLAAWHMWDRLRQSYAALLLFLLLVMGVNGMVMTRDLFNLFVFLEIVSIATYGLLGFDGTPAALAAGLEYILATVLASAFFLLGTTLLYHVTGTLNIDDMIAHRGLIAGPIGTTALFLVLSCLIVELKPFPANGWGLDVYDSASSGVAALVSGAVSAGVFFALFKLLPLFDSYLALIAVSGGATFLFSNLAGLRQSNAQRILGYSSIAQMGLMTLALALMRQLGADAAMPLVVGGLFVNHLLAKAGLFFLAGAVNRPQVDGWTAIAGRPLILVIFAVLLVAIAGLPPFPGFWSKWELVMRAAMAGQYAWIAVILAGSLFEIAYMFRWFKQATRAEPEQVAVRISPARMFPAGMCALLLFVSGYLAADLSGATSLWLWAPLGAAALLFLFDWLPGRVKSLSMLVLVLLIGIWIVSPVEGINRLFAVLLLSGGLVVASASFYRTDPRSGYYPLITLLLLSIAALLRAKTSLEFFFTWEMITLSSYFLIALAHRAHDHALPFLLFSIASAFCLLAGFAMAAATNGTLDLAAFAAAGKDAWPAFVMLAVGFLIKAGAVGVHVWLPGAYAEADDDLSALLSAVVSKVAMFGLFLVTYLAIRSEIGLDMAHLMGWIGLLTTLVGAAMALQQADMKRMLAYSSMSQLGYIVTAIALMSHLGWVTAFYLIANHLMVKGILFLAAAGVILRTGTRLLDENGGLVRSMPFTFAAVATALISMSGLPPLAGFGGKWLLLSAMVEKGWYGLAAIAVLATFVGFLYMFRLAYTVFLGERKAEFATVREAPLALLLPQYVLIIAILALSFFPKPFMEPISAAIDPAFAATLVWDGMSLETIYGYWNPIPVMAITVAIAAVLFGIVWLRYIYGYRRVPTTGVAVFYAFYQPALSKLVRPVAIGLWRGVSELTLGVAGSVRKLYTGNGQTYCLYVLWYVIAIHVVGTLMDLL
ncbi:proton-conducting transporter transmembrane domain-containing protein [Phyllobacterium lublinensis]|uniref:proton-conducting transporter transmembrane domain-containing protein n=1 Tax=Phyllobacterium lublinensis TaxID=2875708 RepID=UPI001CCB7137|nr:proton-conducting transporter membrane subunit [Phyllobacterium sp. 2063]MBZ9655979.1 proton-conducting membrane transporter [Phyllobacterium sp. 2063]